MPAAGKPASITREEAIERLRDYYWMSMGTVTRPADQESAHILADEVLLELINDEFITEIYRAIRRYHGRPD